MGRRQIRSFWLREQGGEEVIGKTGEDDQEDTKEVQAGAELCQAQVKLVVIVEA